MIAAPVPGGSAPGGEAITASIRVDVDDPDAFARYAAAVLPLVERHGGRVVAAGPVTVVEGRPAAGVTWAFVQRWPTRAHFAGFYADADYQPLKAQRQEAAGTELLLIAPSR